MTQEVTGAYSSKHVASLLCKLHQLPVYFLVQFSVLVVTFKALSGFRPGTYGTIFLQLYLPVLLDLARKACSRICPSGNIIQQDAGGTYPLEHHSHEDQMGLNLSDLLLENLILPSSLRPWRCGRVCCKELLIINYCCTQIHQLLFVLFIILLYCFQCVLKYCLPLSHVT